MLILASGLVCVCECFCLSESTLDHDCVTLQHGGRNIKNRCGLLSREYGGERGGGVSEEGGRVGFGQNIPPLLIADPLVCLGYQQGSEG